MQNVLFISTELVR